MTKKEFKEKIIEKWLQGNFEEVERFANEYCNQLEKDGESSKNILLFLEKCLLEAKDIQKGNLEKMAEDCDFDYWDLYYFQNNSLSSIYFTNPEVYEFTEGYMPRQMIDIVYSGFNDKEKIKGVETEDFIEKDESYGECKFLTLEMKEKFQKEGLAKKIIFPYLVSFTNGIKDVELFMPFVLENTNFYNRLLLYGMHPVFEKDGKMDIGSYHRIFYGSLSKDENCLEKIEDIVVNIKMDAMEQIQGGPKLLH